MKVLGIDIGGSGVKAAPVDTRTGKLLAERFRIRNSKTHTPAQVAAIVARLTEHFQWKGRVGVGFPGVIQGSTIWTSANLSPKFVGCDAGKLFGEATGCRVSLINDAAAAGLAEMRFGAGKGFNGKTLLLTLGTGVGSCIAYQGVVVPTEFGHLPWKGNKVAEKFVAASVRADKDLSWKAWSDRLNDYIQVLEQVLWPELIIIGGGVSAKHEKYFKHLKTHARLVPARFFNEAGIVGAALWSADCK